MRNDLSQAACAQLAMVAGLFAWQDVDELNPPATCFANLESRAKICIILPAAQLCGALSPNILGFICLGTEVSNDEDSELKSSPSACNLARPGLILMYM